MIYGAFARHRYVGADELVLVTCHEIGHHLGGAPLVNSWASADGQADYFSTAKCAREYFRVYPKEVSSTDVPVTVVEKCGRAFSVREERQICMRSHLASLNISKLFAEVQGNPMPDFDTPDREVPRRISYGHPRAQCRLDTFGAGAICHVSPEVQFSGLDYKVGACVGEQEGRRPECWFPL